MNFILTSVTCILYFILFAQAAAKENKNVPGAAIVNSGSQNEVTATVNAEAQKDTDSFEIKPLKTPVDKDKPVQTLDDLKEEASEEKLVPISILAVFADPKEVMNTPSPVLIAAEQYIQESGAAGKPQNVRLDKEDDESEKNDDKNKKDEDDKNKNGEDDKSKKNGESAPEEKKEPPSTSETAPSDK